MTIRRPSGSTGLKITTVGLLIGLACAVVGASPPPGTYELYNGEGQKTGSIVSALVHEKDRDQLTTKTLIEKQNVASTYRFLESDTVYISSRGVESVHRDTLDGNKKSSVDGERTATEFRVRIDREGQKLAAAFPLKSFDLTEFEMDLPSSPFRKLKAGQSKVLKVLFFDRMVIIPVSRNVGAPQSFKPKNGGDETPVTVLNTVIRGRPSTSWFDAATGVLLQEEGPDYLLSRTQP